MWILAKYCHATAPIDQQPLHAFLTNNPRGYSHSYQSHSGIYMRDMQRITARISVDGMRGAANGSPRVRYQTVCVSRRCISAPCSCPLSWRISRTWTTLVRSLSASRLALASQVSQQQQTAARRKLTVDAYRRPWAALCRLWESRRRELLTIDRRKGSAVRSAMLARSHARISPRFRRALRMYIAYENPRAK
ncbi:hypothetical protein ALC56_00816 [Trachymyrmex septentrionalis]|uniref:Uncharacterized protein n=1 Tax=Trachymyrmex septentrionalis TaxID=34720 RepID=A0A195FWL5_9HYME|nr:hypothetical protein ALC56_00816 [Trachymyrmex septentrionalis]